jgi:hypothetical protein
MFGERVRPSGAIVVALMTVFVLAVLGAGTADAKFTLKDKVGEKETKLQIYGFTQVELRGGDGWIFGLQDGINSPLEGSDLGDELRQRSRNDDSGPFFAAQRIRIGFNYFNGPLAGKLFLDFNQPHERLFEIDAGMPRMIKDAFIAYRWNNAAFIRMGMIKVPNGMDFTVPGWNLDIVQRGLMEKALVLERGFGVMISGRLIGQNAFTDKPMKTNGLEMGTERQGYGFGYDFWVGNPAARSFAVINTDEVRGEALAYAARVHWDMGKPLHLELSYGISEQAGGDETFVTVGEETEDYKVIDFGIASELLESKLELKGEYINGTDIRGIPGYDQTTYVLTAGYRFVPSAQFMVKTYQAEADLFDPVDNESFNSKLGNTFIGFNLFFARLGSSHRDLQRNKIVVNYIYVNGDGKDLILDENAEPIPSWIGLGGFADDTLAVQWQYKF